jgi:hypothetical protein
VVDVTDLERAVAVTRGVCLQPVIEGLHRVGGPVPHPFLRLQELRTLLDIPNEGDVAGVCN